MPRAASGSSAYSECCCFIVAFAFAMSFVFTPFRHAAFLPRRFVAFAACCYARAAAAVTPAPLPMRCHADCYAADYAA